MTEPKRNDIYWANLEPVQGSEQGGSRPVLIVSNNLMNKFNSVVLAVPMTRKGEKVKAGPFNVPYPISDVEVDKEVVAQLATSGHYFEEIDGVVLCNQARAISKKRLVGRIGNFKTRDTLKRVELAIIDAFGLHACIHCDIPLRPNALSCPQCGSLYRKKCASCGKISSIESRFCSNCGGRI
ncbi:hypothetical protein GCM10025857_14650 [Alicyclobacillus contaminans]|uniref:type II toxin-antitoxin system PemK/MazF family toxin n=1 Tax=Alicyclobacillus contaminans TaxID=392016 RepID=UPI000A03B38B|nr:hypothetical protein GCM10025857_14650 [Alicyclobacillus contaminans]